MAKNLVAWCPRCRDHMPVDSFAGQTTYKIHTSNGVTRCQNSLKDTPYRARDSFAGQRHDIHGEKI